MLNLLWALGRPILFQMDAEDAHELTLRWLPTLTPLLKLLSSPPRHPCKVGPLQWGNPVGLAAGLDKNGVGIEGWEALGFGAIEVGTVTAIPQPGNPKPRLFRLKEERGILNRMGFNNLGAEQLAQRLGALRERGAWPSVPVGANIGKSKVVPNEEAAQDYKKSLAWLKGKADYFTINVSSPNTPGLRALQDREPLARLLEAIVPDAHGTPVFLKIAPDLELEALADAVEVAIEAGCAGIIATNTTLSRPGTCGRLEEAGGLSGDPLWPLAREKIGGLLQVAQGRLPVVGVGGVHSRAQVQELLQLGCAAVQIYSGMIYEGPGLPARLGAAGYK
ncbi:MAG TPA: quinone-dependent dihydroorotate dehydrogenase [Myxococcota bacterium]|nr:quinone-dependent dihydroorotate dehydrogenase [Myxococcota bacterium]HND29112.1 quinone-dependent dihydroorotate dehydrogenase [Myxococcota bacterium]